MGAPNVVTSGAFHQCEKGVFTIKHISYVSSTIYFLAIAFAVYVGFTWVLQVFPFFFVAMGIIMFGCMGGCTIWMMINKTRAIMKVDTNGVKTVASRTRSRTDGPK